MTDKLVRYVRPRLTEEYSASVDGIRQDFLITERPDGEGDLCVELSLSGARAEALASGAKLTLDGSQRELAYSRLRATDATGRELDARIEVASVDHLVICVADDVAAYPVRIDPTFSDADWVGLDPGLPGADSTVRDFIADAMGNLYIGGYFTVIGSTRANSVAKWNGSSWSALGSGMNGGVSALALLGNDLYAGGGFTTAGGNPANCIAKWDGTNWTALGSGMSGGTYGPGVYALAVVGTDLYAGGDFATVGGISTRAIGKWNGSSWSALGSGMAGGNYATSVYALAVSGGNVIAGGDFATAGGTAASGIARWDGINWSPLGSGIIGYHPYVKALAVSGSVVYAGGSFTNAGGTAASHVARWDGSNWSPLGAGVGGPQHDVYALAAAGSVLYAGGYFTTAGGIEATYIAKWNGTSWSSLGSGVGYSVSSLKLIGGILHVGGVFKNAGGIPASHLAKWSGTSWSAFASERMNGAVNALALLGGDLYAGGAFTKAGGRVVNYVARWNGSSWTNMGMGVNSSVRALAVAGSDLYVGGNFSMATNSGGVAVRVNSMARWNGNTWSALGSGMNGAVAALAISGGSNLYAGGEFSTATNAGGVAVPVNYVARWNGTSWSALGLGLSSGIYALAVSGSNLYAGGYWQFVATNSDGTPVSVTGVAKWNGTSWSALGAGGVDNGVRALAVLGDDLYVGGYFNYLAKWNGSSWSTLGVAGSSSPTAVYALACSGADLYVGGAFTTAGGIRVNRIAKWDGSSWSALGSGVNGGVLSLAISGGELYAGGDFTTAGQSAATYVAKARIVLPVVPSILNNPLSCTNIINTTATFSVTAGGDVPLSYQWRKGGTNLQNDSRIAGATTTNLVIANVQPGDAGDYTVAVTNFAGSVTSSVAQLTVTGGPAVPPHVQNVHLNAGQFAFDLDGDAGCKLLIQASTDLKHWVTLRGCQLTNSPLGFVDPDSHLHPQRFYRLMDAAGVAMMEQQQWSSGQFHFNLVGEVGRTVVVQATTNLTDWSPIATNVLGSDPMLFTDPQSPQFPQRFYRLHKP